MRFEIRKVEKEELLGSLLELFHKIYSARWKESLPEEPLISLESLKLDIEDDDNSSLNRFLAFSDDTIVGFSIVDGQKPGSPDYELNKELGWLDVYVTPEQRLSGVGKRLAEVALREANKSSLKSIGISTYLESGQKFIEYLGGSLVSKYSDRQLDLSKLDWNLIDNWLEIRQSLDPRWIIELRTVVSDDFIEEIVDLDHEIMQELRSMSQALYRSTREGAVDNLKQLAKWLEKTGDSYVCFLVNDDFGNVIGYTEGKVDKEHPERYYQFVTGVKKTKRGLGLGKFLKAIMFNYLRKEFPLVETAITGSNDLNDPMHGINNKLGFSRGSTNSTYRIVVDKTLKKLGV
jgi:mycothiol synthase